MFTKSASKCMSFDYSVKQLLTVTDGLLLIGVSRFSWADTIFEPILNKSITYFTYVTLIVWAFVACPTLLFLMYFSFSPCTALIKKKKTKVKAINNNNYNMHNIQNRVSGSSLIPQNGKKFSRIGLFYPFKSESPPQTNTEFRKLCLTESNY